MNAKAPGRLERLYTLWGRIYDLRRDQRNLAGMFLSTFFRDGVDLSATAMEHAERAAALDVRLAAVGDAITTEAEL